MDSAERSASTHSLDSNLSVGWRYQLFEQLDPGKLSLQIKVSGKQHICIVSVVDVVVIRLFAIYNSSL